MQNGSLENAIIGGFFVLVGLIMVVFRKEFKELNESFYRNLPEALGLLRARGRLLTFVIVTFGLVSVLGGIAVLIREFAEP